MTLKGELEAAVDVLSHQPTQWRFSQVFPRIGAANAHMTLGRSRRCLFQASRIGSFVPMVTLGVDLASQAGKTAACLIRWDGGSAHVECPRIGLEDRDLLRLFNCPEKRPDKIGIDAPFGWPVDFVGAIHAHSTYMHWPHVNHSRLRLRRTDHFVRQKAQKAPLSVAADKIAMTAMRAARLLAKVYEAGEDVDRTGMNGRFVEVYPAAALKRWGLPIQGHKGPGKEDKRDKRDKLVCDLEGKTGLQLTDEVRSGCRESDDQFDAFVAALVTRAAATECCEPIPDEDRGRAGKEGWIALPQSDSLARLNLPIAS